MEHREDEEEEITEVAELSVNSVVGLSAPHTIKLRGTINGEEVVVLIDSGATHNFISESLVRRLGLTRGTSRGYGVMVGGGMIVQGKGICEEVQLKCSSLKFLSVDNNNIKDTFPFWLKGLPNLQAFTLRSNRFYGPISPPASLQRVPKPEKPCRSRSRRTSFSTRDPTNLSLNPCLNPPRDSSAPMTNPRRSNSP